MLGFSPLGGVPLGDDGAGTSAGHSLIASDIVTGAPLLGAPAITQNHLLSGTALSTGAPALGTASLSQVHGLAPTDLSTGAPILGAPPIGQRHSFTAIELGTPAPTLDMPALSIAGQLVAVDISAGAPSLGAAAIGQAHALAAAGIVTEAPVLGAPFLRQAHGLTFLWLLAGTPTLGAPSLSIVAPTAPPSGLSPEWEDMDIFFDLDDFGIRATIETEASGTRQVVGIFDDPYMNAQLGEYDMDTSRPRFLAKDTDLVGIRRGDFATIAGKSYNVLTGPKSTGDGMASLELAEA